MKYTPFPGQELRDQREALGVTIEEAFRKTRVPISYLKALEKGVVHELPTSCYTIGFLKTYCQFLGLAPERYLDSFQTLSRPDVARYLRRANGTDEKPAIPGWVQDLATWGMVTAVVLIGWLAYSLIFHPGTGNAPKVEAGVEMVVPEPMTTPVAPKPKP